MRNNPNNGGHGCGTGKKEVLTLYRFISEKELWTSRYQGSWRVGRRNRQTLVYRDGTFFGKNRGVFQNKKSNRNGQRGKSSSDKLQGNKMVGKESDWGEETSMDRLGSQEIRRKTSEEKVN